MTKLLMTLIVALAPLAALADGSAKLDFIGQMAGYDLVQKGDTITGFVSNLGPLMHGTVELKKVNGQWQGHMGMAQIVSGSSIMTSANEGHMNMSISSLGQQNFSFKLKANELQVRGMLHNGNMLSGGLLSKGKEVASYSNVADMSLEQKSLGNFEGNTVIYTSTMPDFIPTEIASTGSLSPEELAVTDRPLFVLLYMMPLNSSN